MKETFVATRHEFDHDQDPRTSESVSFLEEDPETYETLHCIYIEGGSSYGFYVEYGDQGNANYDAVERLELSPRSLRIAFRPEAALTSWDYFMDYTPGRVWDLERDGDVRVIELTIQFGYSMSHEEWDTLRMVMERVAETHGGREYTVLDE